MTTMPYPNRAIKLGLIGCGRGTMVHHLPALARLDAFKVEAVADLNPSRLEMAATRFGANQAFSDYRELLRQKEIEAVLVATPTASHAEIGVAAFEEGKHAVLEKPLALTAHECDQLIDGAARSSRIALVAFNSRWHRLVPRARELIREGVIGQPVAVQSTYTHSHSGEGAQEWHKSRSLGGGVLFNDGVHHFDLWRYLLGTVVRDVSAFSLNSAHFEDDTCSLTARMENGILASALFSFSTSANSELQIFGERGRLLLSLYRFDGLEFYPSSSLPGGLGTRLVMARQSLKALPQAIADLRRGGSFGATYEGMWRHFGGCIRDGLPVGCTLEDGKKAVEVALAALKSVETGSASRLTA